MWLFCEFCVFSCVYCLQWKSPEAYNLLLDMFYPVIKQNLKILIYLAFDCIYLIHSWKTKVFLIWCSLRLPKKWPLANVLMISSYQYAVHGTCIIFVKTNQWLWFLLMCKRIATYFCLFVCLFLFMHKKKKLSVKQSLVVFILCIH